MNRATSRENQGLAAAVGAPAHWHQALSSPLSLQDPQPSTQGPLWISPGGRGGGVCSLPRGMSSGLAQSKRVLSTVRAPGQGQHPGPAATPGRPPAADGRGEGSGSPAPILSSLACGNSRRHLHSWARGHISVTHTVVPTHAVVPAPSTLPPHTLMFTLVCTLLPLRACSTLPPPKSVRTHKHTPMRTSWSCAPLPAGTSTPPCSPHAHPSSTPMLTPLPDICSHPLGTDMPSHAAATLTRTQATCGSATLPHTVHTPSPRFYTLWSSTVAPSCPRSLCTRPLGPTHASV